MGGHFTKSHYPLHVGSRSPAISSGWVRLGDPLAGYLDGKMLANVLSNARNTLFDPLPQIQNYIIPLFQGNVIVDDYSKGNVVIPLFPKNQGHYSIIPLQKFPLFLCIIPLQPPIMLRAPKSSSRQFIFHRKCVLLSSDICDPCSSQAIDCFLVSKVSSLPPVTGCIATLFKSDLSTKPFINKQQ